MMMVSAIAKKSIGDLKKRKSRTIFTILTIALGVAALGMFAVVPLFNEAVLSDIKETNMWNVRANMPNTHVSDDQIAEIEDMENINGAEFKQVFYTKIYIGERRNDALFVGMRDFGDMKVDRVSLEKGEYPGHLEVLADSGNSRYDLFREGIGGNVKVMDANGGDLVLNITGKGRTMVYDSAAYGIAVFFVDVDTVSILSNSTGYNSISLDLEKTSGSSMDDAILMVKTYLEENTDFVAFTDIPDTNQDGHWPGEEDFSDTGSFFYVLTFMTLFCAVFLISNTMHTIITEQRKEIAQMKAVGATRLMITRSYLTTSFIMGTVGSVIGAGLGILLGYGMVWFLATSFYGFVPSFGIHYPTLVISALVGIALTILATLPALLGAIRTNTREGLQDSGISASYGASFIDKVLLRTRWLPRSSQMGFRNVARKKGRSISTMLQVSLAVAMFLGVVTIGYSLATTVEKEYDYYTFDILVNGQMDGGRPLTEGSQQIIEDIDGVKEVEPILISFGELKGDYIAFFGYHHDTLAYDVDGTMATGRWFNEEEQSSMAMVMVMGRNMARITGNKVGDMVTVETATGPHTFEIIGINAGQMMNGRTGYIPMDTLQSVLKWNDTVTAFAVTTDTKDHELIDRVSTEIEDTMMARGYVVNNEIWYVMKENNVRQNQNIVNLMIATGSLIVFITMIGLMSTLTMNILERTREIGMLRCIGSRAGHIRRVFGTEGLTMAFFGGLLGIPLGYLTASFLNWIMYEIMKLEMDLLFPLRFILIALVMTLVITLVVIQLPLFRAVRFRPGDALRYQ
ncbi:MAG: FtsX-like permease family protein [Thermoplasmatota archaeon]